MSIQNTDETGFGLDLSCMAAAGGQCSLPSCVLREHEQLPCRRHLHIPAAFMCACCLIMLYAMEP
jgi:hypothetical protein